MRSPLARHPFLLARKLRERAGHPLPVAPPPTAPLRYLPDAQIADLLRRWIGYAKPAPYDLRAEEVFGHVFDRADLLRWCANGPETGVGPQADIKTPWEFARSQHMPLLAAFPAPKAVNSLVRRFESEIREIAAAAADLDGPLWTNAMEVAIRAINWTAADDLLEGRLSRAFDELAWADLIHLHGRVIWARLEAKLRSSNHYLADLLGLSWIARHFDGDPDAARWRAFADREFPDALRAQTFPDGGAYEASLPYHALITEMALLHLALLETPDPDYTRHLDRMLAILAAARRSDGSLFAIGDDDSGRIIAVDRLTPGRGYADSLLLLAKQLLPGEPARDPALLLPHTGWYFRRDADWHLAANFGGVGFAGQGAHAHGDVFSFCLDWKGVPVFIDPGSFIYSGDPESRNRFRRASAHSVFAPDGRDPYPVPEGRNHLFAMPGPARAYSAHADERCLRMSGAPFGFPYARTIEWTDANWIIRDEFQADSEINPVWFFQIGPDFTVAPRGDSAIELVGPVGRLTLCAEFPVRIEILEGSVAPRYGHRLPCARIRAVSQPAREATLTWRIAPT